MQQHGPREYPTKWSKSERGRQIPYDITCIWSLKYDTNEFIYKTKADSQTQRTDCLSFPSQHEVHYRYLYIYTPHLKNGRLKLTIFPIQG